MIDPNQERFYAKRAKAKTIEVKASHVSMVSHPVEVAALIDDAAANTAQEASRHQGTTRTTDTEAGAAAMA
jgi:hypothetical protein